MATSNVRGYRRTALRGPWSTVSTFAALLAYRFINAFMINTFFQPDEYFQSLEPAWQIAFGRDSGAWITWVRTRGTVLRSPQTDSTGMARMFTFLDTSSDLRGRLSGCESCQPSGPSRRWHSIHITARSS
nr:gpi mannosyltransferase 3 [Quercus suber]